MRLPFKKNEDINPINASHSGMSPEHFQLAKIECEEQLQRKLIELCHSPWACEAFYVNKRVEQLREKLSLVINCQPLNHFLQDDKFSLPNRESLLATLLEARIFSNFNLKAGFWQLGVHPDDKLETGFCIPNAHFQWIVMLFGLKTAPLLFQKAMCKICIPIMDRAFIYINDIFLFSPTEESHIQLLEQFANLVYSYGIMLYEKKMIIGQKEIQSLGMTIREGQYQPDSAPCQQF